MKRFFIFIISRGFIIGLFWVLSYETIISQTINSRSHYEASYLFLYNYPWDESTFWGNDDWLTNGIANDGENWYIGSHETDALGFPFDGNWTIWRIPVQVDLKSTNNALISEIQRYDEGLEILDVMHYGHVGDLVCYHHNDGIDYLLVPFTSYSHYEPGGVLVPPYPPIVAFFEADNLSFIDYEFLDSTQTGIGWCAVNPANGELYTSNNETDSILQYHINWSNVENTSTHDDGLSLVDSHPLKYEGEILTIHDMQGGEFTPSGELIYISSGVHTQGITLTDGLHVFDTSGDYWEKVMTSFDQGGYMTEYPPYFLFQFDNSISAMEEPEGLTYWNVGGLNAPNIMGELHVILYNHNFWSGSRVYLKHYTNKIYVDFSAPEPPSKQEYNLDWPIMGSPFRPFNTVSNALTWYPHWDGSAIAIRSGVYPETGIYSAEVNILQYELTARVILTEWNGPAIIGLPE